MGAIRKSSPRFWTAERLLELEACIEKGMTDTAIGKHLGCSSNAVQIARKRNGIASRRQVMLTGHAISQKLGLTCSKRVTMWIERGYLKGRRGQQVGRSRMWYVTEEALLAFMEDPRTWPLWKPERITEKYLRDWALEIRTVRYLRPGEVANRFAVGANAVNDWIHQGRLPAQRWGNWWIRESDLDGFEPPCERPRQIVNMRRFAAWEDERLLGMRSAGHTWSAIGAVLNRSISSLFGRYQRLQAMEVRL